MRTVMCSVRMLAIRWNGVKTHKKTGVHIQGIQSKCVGAWTQEREYMLLNCRKIQLKRKQHYVFQCYLKNWETDNNIWCLRNRKDLFKCGTKGVALERDFYKVHAINEEEERFILEILLYPQPQKAKSVILEYINMHNEPFKVKQFLDEFKKRMNNNSIVQIPDKVNDNLRELEKYSEETIYNMDEDYHSLKEQQAIPQIEKLKNGDISFYYDTIERAPLEMNDASNFINFLVIQYFRTKKMRKLLQDTIDNLIKKLTVNSMGININNVNVEHILGPYIFFLQSQLTDSLRGDKVKLILLKNKTNIPFITSDQPVFNIYFSHSNITKKLLFFYPISPQVAVLLGETQITEKVVEVQENEVKKYNDKMADFADDFLFSSNENVLKRYIKHQTHDSKK